MNHAALLDLLGTEGLSAVIGLVVGLTFGIFAQQSRFCLRAACAGSWRSQTGKKFAARLLAFVSSTA